MCRWIIQINMTYIGISRVHIRLITIKYLRSPIFRLSKTWKIFHMLPIYVHIHVCFRIVTAALTKNIHIAMYSQKVLRLHYLPFGARFLTRLQGKLHLSYFVSCQLLTSFYAFKTAFLVGLGNNSLVVTTTINGDNLCEHSINVRYIGL